MRRLFQNNLLAILILSTIIIGRFLGVNVAKLVKLCELFGINVFDSTGVGVPAVSG